MNILTATKARSNLYQLLKKVLKEHLPVKISSKEGNVVVISEEEYESLLETAELLSIPGFKESIKKADKEIEKGNVVAFDEVFN